MQLSRSFVGVISVCATLSGAASLAAPPSPSPSASPGAAQDYGVDLSLLDTSTRPCDDFYQYACGGWLAKTEIPADRPMWSRSFSTIQLNNLKTLDGILRGYVAGKKEPANPYSGLLADFYGSCMDEPRIEKHGLEDFKDQLKPIEKLDSLKDLAPLVVRLQLAGANVLFAFGEEQDAKDSTQVIGVADQAGLTLPDRDYYLSKAPKMEEIRGQYREYVSRMLKLLGDSDTDAEADSILRIETGLATASMSLVDRRNPNNVYHRLERKGLMEKTPDFDWDRYFDTLDKDATGKLQAIDVSVPDFFSGLNAVLKSTPLPALRTYLRWHLLSASTEALPKRFIDESFRFSSHALSGQKELEPRWKRCVRMTDREIGFALGRAFVAVAYGESGKARSQAMIGEIEAQLHQVLGQVAWLDAKTRKEAELKFSKIKNKVGYPAVWRSYDGLKADRDSFLKSLQAASAFGDHYELAKIGKPLDPNEWDMTPSTVNAYYDPQRNEIVFPAGILQYPFFNKDSPDSLNYGAIGMVMGHELTHGYDDQGREFDANGNLRNWWDKSVLEKFDKRTACVVDEYGHFEALPGVKLNGKLTLGENIADQGGLKLSFQAWKARHPGKEPAANGLTNEQEFFLAFAQSWCEKEQEQYTRLRSTIDPHSPSRYRVDGVVSQFPPFAKAFSCHKGSKMASAQRCEVW